MADQEQQVQLGEFKDRSTGLVLFGVFEILIGGICALLVPLMLVGVAVSARVDPAAGAAMNVRMMIPAAAIYVLAAVWFVWMGIGSIRARRWARALMLVSSWMWLIFGIVGLAFFIFFMGDMYDRMAQGGQMPPEALVVAKLVMTGVVGCIYVILPGIFVLFYQSKHVKATCERKDPQVRWTDKCPLPVLALSLMFGFGAFSMIWSASYGFIVPFFGVILDGIQGALATVVFTLVLGYVAWGTYKLKSGAWWTAVALNVLGTASAVITFSRVNMLEVWKRMDMPEQQLQVLRDSGIAEIMPWWMVIWAVPFLAYLLYTKRYFIPSGQERGHSGSPREK